MLKSGLSCRCHDKVITDGQNTWPTSRILDGLRSIHVSDSRSSTIKQSELIRNVKYFHMTSRRRHTERTRSFAPINLHNCRIACMTAWTPFISLIYTPCSCLSNTVLGFGCSLYSNHGEFSNLSSERRWMDIRKIRWRFRFENACLLHSPSKVIVRFYHEFSDEIGWRFRSNIS